TQRSDGGTQAANLDFGPVCHSKLYESAATLSKVRAVFTTYDLAASAGRKRTMSRKAIARRSVVTAALPAPFLSSAGWAQGAWPTRPIRIVVPFNPGGAIDALVRVI